MGRKQLAELNLLDRFLFNEAMEDPENMKAVLDIIFEGYIFKIGTSIGKKRYGRFRITARLGWMCMHGMKRKNVYDTEAQKEDTKIFRNAAVFIRHCWTVI